MKTDIEVVQQIRISLYRSEAAWLYSLLTKKNGEFTALDVKLKAELAEILSMSLDQVSGD